MKRLENIREACAGAGLLPCLETAVRAALEAGALIRERYERPHDIRLKGEIDLVTEADLASEERILALLHDRFPDHAVLSEEGAAGPAIMPEEPIWIVDPLDGTTNFAHGFPWVAVSIAFAVGGLGQLGVVYNPLFDELFCAVRGAGTWLNGRRVQVSSAPGLGSALLATGFPYNIEQHQERVVGSLRALLLKSRGVRRAGAAALDLAYVACGRLDGFWELELKPWDTAAGQVLVEEAGGRLSDLRGRPFSPFFPECLASNQVLHGELVESLKPFAGST